MVQQCLYIPFRLPTSFLLKWVKKLVGFLKVSWWWPEHCATEVTVSGCITVQVMHVNNTQDERAARMGHWAGSHPQHPRRDSPSSSCFVHNRRSKVSALTSKLLLKTLHLSVFSMGFLSVSTRPVYSMGKRFKNPLFTKSREPLNKWCNIEHLRANTAAGKLRSGSFLDS